LCSCFRSVFFKIKGTAHDLFSEWAFKTLNKSFNYRFFLIVTNSKSPRNQVINIINKKYLCTFEL
jgi:hypothetical protein